MRRFRAALACGLALAPLSASAQTIYGISYQDQLVTFSAANPQVLTSAHFFSGLASNDHIIAVDFRPSTGELYGLGAQNRIYRIDAATAAASQVGVPFAPQLNGTEFDIDFNPVSDSLTVVSNFGQNLSVNPTTGVATTNPNLNLPSSPLPFVNGIAYTNNSAGAGSTQLYGISNRNNTGGSLYSINAVTGVMASVSSINLAGNSDAGGFDILGPSLGFALLTNIGQNESFLVQFDLANPTVLISTSAIGAPPGGGGPGPIASIVRDIAVQIPAPGSTALLAFLGLTAARRRRN